MEDFVRPPSPPAGCGSLQTQQAGGRRTGALAESAARLLFRRVRAAATPAGAPLQRIPLCLSVRFNLFLVSVPFTFVFGVLVPNISWMRHLSAESLPLAAALSGKPEAPYMFKNPHFPFRQMRSGGAEGQAPPNPAPTRPAPRPGEPQAPRAREPPSSGRSRKGAGSG